MSEVDSLSPVVGLSNDGRVRVFRRIFSMQGATLQVDAYAIISERFVVVCDTLLCPADMAQVLLMLREELKGRQLLVLNSHADWDHAWGNCYFEPSIPIIAHALCLARLQATAAQAQLADYQQSYALFRQVILTPPTISFAHALSIHGGDLTLELLHAPGHTADHCVLWLPELRLLLAFDAAEMPFPGIENAQEMPAMFATLERLQSLQPQHVLCAHGKTNSPEILTRNLAYLRTIEHHARQYLAAHPHRTQPLDSVAIGYTFEQALVGAGEIADPVFYRSMHEQNVHCILQWLGSSRSFK